jgi:transglutaminase-like putative cysteine protease
MCIRTLLAACIVLVLCGDATAVPGDVASTLPLPFNHPTGIAWTGERWWVADRSDDTFSEIDPVSGSVTSVLVSPGWFPSGLAWHDGLLWSTDPGVPAIYATDPSTGRTIRTLESPTPSPTGIAWNGDDLWICDNRDDRILHIDPLDGTTITSFPSPASDPRGIAFGGGYLWCSDRLRDEIHMIDPVRGLVVMTLDAPGKFCWDLAWRGDRIAAVDYQDDTVYELVVDDGQTLRESNPRRALVDFTTEAVATGAGGTIESLDIFYAVPSDRPGQRLIADLEFDPAPEMTSDRWGQRIAAFHFADLEPGATVEVTMRARVEAYAVRYYIVPDKVGSKIPDQIRKLYLANDVKYDIDNPYIQKIVRETVGDEKNLYWRARLLYQYLIEHMEYQLAGGWNTAPTVLERGNGSCSEYTFSLIALLRAAGVPARYVGSLVVRGDDASYDDVFHRWNEVYLPGYGWVPVDANAGDRPFPADQGAAFGGISNRFLVTTEGGGNSEYLGWGYNYENRWISTGKCHVKTESVAEWEPLEEPITP